MSWRPSRHHVIQDQVGGRSAADLLSSQSFTAQTEIVHLVCLSSLFKCSTQCHTGVHASSGLI